MNLAQKIEEKGAKTGVYPPDWPIIATRVKALAKWCCERCGVKSNEESPDGTMLTVHHLDGVKWNLELWNLAALCQRCHLRIQSKVVFLQVPQYYNWKKLEWVNRTEHSLWMAKHIKGYNVWAMLNDKHQIPLTEITERSYENEWPQTK